MFHAINTKGFGGRGQQHIPLSKTICMVTVWCHNIQEVNPQILCKQYEWHQSFLQMHKLTNQTFDGGLRVQKPLLCLAKEILTICRTRYEVHLRDTRGLRVVFFHRVSFRACTWNRSRCAWGAYKWDVPHLPFDFPFFPSLGYTNGQACTQTPSSWSAWRRRAPPQTLFHSQTHHTESSSQGTGCKTSWTEILVNSQT